MVMRRMSYSHELIKIVSSGEEQEENKMENKENKEKAEESDEETPEDCNQELRGTKELPIDLAASRKEIDKDKNYIGNMKDGDTPSIARIT